MTSVYKMRPPAEMIRHHISMQIIKYNKANPDRPIPDAAFGLLRQGITAAYDQHEKEIANAD